MQLNFYAAWIGILFGFISGAILGLFFYKEEWLGGYSSWCRRMLRLAHISFFGIAFINLIYALSIVAFNVEITIQLPTYLFIAGAITMPLICYLAAYKKVLRQLFPVPVICLVLGTLIFIINGLL